MSDELSNAIRILEQLQPDKVKALLNSIDLLNEKMRVLGDDNSDLAKQELLKGQLEIYEDIEAILFASREFREQQIESLNRQLKTEGQIRGVQSERYKSLQAQIEALEDINNLSAEDLDKLRQANRAQKNLTQNSLQTLEANKQIAKSTAEFVGTLTGIDDSWKTTVVGGMIDLVSKSDDLADAMKRTGKAIAEQLSPANILGSTYMKVMEVMQAWALITIDFAEKQDEMVASVREAALGSKEFDDIVVDAQLNVRSLGVSTQEMGAAFVALHRNMSEFTSMNKEAQVELLEFTAVMNEFGVSADVTAGNLQILTKSLGFTSQVAIEVNRDLIAVGQAIGMNADQIIAGFGQAMPVLAKYGKDAPEIFKRVAAASKATGISIQGLISITEGMDTFEGAGEAAGRLNALLGGTVNALDLLNATEEERIGILIRSVEQSGRSWESMGRFERQAIASAAGISNMAEANMLFGMSSSAYDEMIAKTQATALSQEELEAATRAQMSVTEKLEALIQSFAVSMRPVVEGFGMMLDFVLKLRKEMGMGFNIVLLGTLGIMGMIALTIGAVVGALVLFKGAVALATAGQFVMTLASGGLTAALVAIGAIAKPTGEITEKAGEQIGKGGIKALPAAPIFMSVGFAIGSIGLAAVAATAAFIVLIIYLPQVVEAFKEMVPFMFMLPFYAYSAAVALNILGVGVTVFSTIMAIAYPVVILAAAGLMTLGLASVYLGVGMLALGKGVEVFASQVGKLPEVVSTLLDLSLAMSALLIFGSQLAPYMIVVGLALLPLALGIGAIGLGLAAMNKNFKVIGKMTTELVKFSGAIFDLILFGSAFSGFLITTGLAIMPVGIGVALLGVGLLSLGFGLEKIKKEADGLGMLAKQIGLFSSALGLLGILAGGGIFIIGVALGALGLGLLSLGFAIDTMKSGLRGLGVETSEKLVSFFSSLGKGIAELADVGITDMAALLAVGQSGLTELIEATVKIKPENVDAVGVLIDKSAKLAEVRGSAGGVASAGIGLLSKSVDAISGLFGGGGGGAGGGGGSKTIVLKIGEREFARAVIDAIEDYNELEI